MPHKILHRGKYRHFVRHRGWEFVKRAHGAGIAVIVPVTEDQRLIFVEQHRIPVGKNVIEFPAGLANDQAHFRDRTLRDTARRELLEETGYKARTLTYITEGPSSSATSNDILTFFYATGLTKVASGGGDETEEITVHEVPLAKVDAWLSRQRERGRLVDPKVYTGLYHLLKQKRPRSRLP